MDHNAFVELSNREIAKLQWWTEAREVILDLKNAESAKAKAEAARTQALADRDKALADIEARKERDAKAAASEKAKLDRALVAMQTTADKMLAETQAQLERTQLVLGTTQGELAEAKVARDRFLAQKATEERETQARIDALLAQERDIKERLAAALGR